MAAERSFSFLPVSCAGWLLLVRLSRGTGCMLLSGSLSALVWVSRNNKIASDCERGCEWVLTICGKNPVGVTVV